MPTHPLAEVFGFPIDNFSAQAALTRSNKLCPFNNRVPNCTKDKANDPLGVCSIFSDDGHLAITCPIRFRQNWTIAIHAASFFFPSDANWTSLSEVRLNDRNGQSAGNIDLVLVSYDERGRILDFGTVEVQAVYISGNVRAPFEFYMTDPEPNSRMEWAGTRNYPRADYLSSSRKRLVPQLIYKGGILKHWGKKQAVILHKDFYRTLPVLDEVNREEADIAWFLYDLEQDSEQNLYQLNLDRVAYTHFKPALDRIVTAEPGPIDRFVDYLQGKLHQKLDYGEENPPDAPTIDQLL